MSRNKNYNKFYKNPQTEEPVNETSVEEVQATEETVETPAEEAPVEEEKTEEVPTDKESIREFAVVSGAKRVNLRMVPNAEGKVLTILNEGTKVEVIETVDKVWTSVCYNGEAGYMMSMYLRPID